MAETLTFEAEARELLDLVIHSLYKRKEIFLRELLSNASDALDRLRFESLTRPELRGPSGEGEELAIRIEADRDARTLSVVDDGIGMSRDELVSNLGTIARSGTRTYLDKLRESRAAGTSDLPALPELIGQFGVGFYSSFIVAAEVEVETRRAGEEQGHRWSSTGEGDYTIEEVAGLPRGTRVRLRLREGEEGDPDFLDEHVLRDLVRRYSDFVEYPIRMETAEGVETLNSMRPLWQRPKDDITPEQYAEFYRHLTHDPEDPLETIHFRAEGTLEYTALLYLPKHRPLDLFEDTRGRARLALYVRRVLIMPECEDLLPSWLRFVRGLVDSPDLPLNVSREVLQSNPQVRAIEKRLTKKVLNALSEILEKDRARYAELWSAFGAVIKEGIHLGADQDGQISRIALFSSTRGEEPTTLGEYVARMAKDQRAIYYLTGAERRALASSPHLEAFRARGYEVLLLTDPVDEWVVMRLTQFDGKPLKAVDRGALDVASGAEREALETRERESRELLAAVERALADDVGAVRFTARLADSPAVLVAEEGGLSPNLERILAQARQDVPRTKRALELNPDHPLVLRLASIYAAEKESPRFAELSEILFGQAVLAEGSPLADPARFTKLLARWLAGDAASA